SFPTRRSSDLRDLPGWRPERPELHPKTLLPDHSGGENQGSPPVATALLRPLSVIRLDIGAGRPAVIDRRLYGRMVAAYGAIGIPRSADFPEPHRQRVVDKQPVGEQFPL